jgi:hypothetical protein
MLLVSIFALLGLLGFHGGGGGGNNGSNECEVDIFDEIDIFTAKLVEGSRDIEDCLQSERDLFDVIGDIITRPNEGGVYTVVVAAGGCSTPPFSVPRRSNGSSEFYEVRNCSVPFDGRYRGQLQEDNPFGTLAEFRFTIFDINVASQ